MKKFLALLLCLSMILTLMPAVFATETTPTEDVTTQAETTAETSAATVAATETTAATTEATEETTVETTEETTEATEETTEATEETTEETTEATEETTEETTEPMEGESFTTFTTLDGNSVEVGDKIWIKNKQLVYKSTTDTEGYKTLFPHEITIEKITVVGDTTWFHFKNHALNILGYKYVKASSTSTTEPGENDCDCGSDSENLADHADDCARKKYVLSLIQKDGEFKTAEEIFEAWDNFDEETKTDIWGLLDKMDPELSKDLEAMTEGTAAVILNEFDKLESAYENLPEDASYEACETFYGQMMAAYSKAFDNDVTIVSGEEMQKIDAAFGELEKKLYEEYGYSEIQAPVMAISNGVHLSGNETGDSMGSVEDSLILEKNVNVDEDGVSDYLLTLESYVKGFNYTQPVDVVLVLDQSASMYAPMGVKAGLDNSTLYTETNDSTLRYTFNTERDDSTGECAANTIDLTEQMKVSEFVEKIQQLGYLVAQSRAGGAEYCTTSHADGKHNNNCNKTYDWFVVQYVPEDPNGEVWHMYRTKRTACPAGDSWNDQTWVIRCVKFTQEQIGDRHFYFYKSQTGALYDSITAFADALHENAKQTGADHRMAIAGFSTGVPTSKNSGEHFGSGFYVNGAFKSYNTNTNRNENDYEEQANVYEDSTLTTEDYKTALVSVKDNYQSIQDSLKAVKTEYYHTYQNIGFDIAKKILKNAPAGEERNKVVILFTDGEPSLQASLGNNPKTYNMIIPKAKEVKALGAEVYTICTSTLEAEKRAFLTYSSSDYPDAKSMTEYGDEKSQKYALTAKSSDELVKAFMTVVQNISDSYLTLDTATVLQDTISEYFALPKAITNAMTDSGEVDEATLEKYIKVYTAEYLGNDAFEASEKFEDAKIEIVKGTDGRYSVVRISNFDYSENYLTERGRGDENFCGKKLIVTIAIDVADTNLGGNYQPTNVEDSSGIYTGTKNVKQLPVPYVDIPTMVTVTKKVEGKKADTSKEFSFDGSKIKISSWDYASDDDHYLKATIDNDTLSFKLSDGESHKIEELYVGSTLTITETVDSNYTAEIKVYKADGKTEITPTKNEHGSLEVTVEPGMQIVYTNTCLLTDLTIKKEGLETIDENQSTIFKVTGDNGFAIKVVILGNQSVTIKDIFAGEYKVEELTDWSWRYTTGETEQTIEAKYDAENKVTFTNEREEEHWLSGDAYCKNLWGAKTADKS